MQIIPTSIANAAQANMTTSSTAANTPMAPRRLPRNWRRRSIGPETEQRWSFTIPTSIGCKLRQPGGLGELHGFASRLHSRFAVSLLQSRQEEETTATLRHVRSRGKLLLEIEVTSN